MTEPEHRIVATRRLTYAFKDDPTRWVFTVCIGEPYLVTEDMEDFAYAPNSGACVVSFDGLPEKEEKVHGADTIQAIELAVGAMESYLHRLRKKYDFFFDDGEPYFED